MFSFPENVKKLKRQVDWERNKRKQLSLKRSILREHGRPVGSADLDQQQERFLLTASGTVVRLFDLDRACPDERDLEPEPISHRATIAANALAVRTGNGNGDDDDDDDDVGYRPPLRTEPVFRYQAPPYRRSLSSPAAAAAAGGPQHLSRVRWYPHDQAMFVTGSYGHTVRVWDARRASVAHTFDLRGLVHDLDLSACARTHALTAVATSSYHVQLCDLTTGKAAQSLTGHSGELRTVRWSLRSEFQLVSGSVDNSLRLWDIRQSRSCLRNFAQNADSSDHQSATTATDQQQPSTAHSGAVNAVCMVTGTDLCVSSGSDHRVHLWRLADGRRLPVQFPLVLDKTAYGAQLVTSSDGRLLYHGHGQAVVALNLQSGHEQDRLLAHFGHVTGALVRARYHQVYTYGSDGIVFCWVPATQPSGDTVPSDLDHQVTASDPNSAAPPLVVVDGDGDCSSISEDWV